MLDCSVAALLLVMCLLVLLVLMTFEHLFSKSPLIMTVNGINEQPSPNLRSDSLSPCKSGTIPQAVV
jgi:hypothetical protein